MQIHRNEPADRQAVSAPAALLAAFADTQRLFAGKEGRQRWRALAVLAMMAGVVGVGAQPPPLGLLQPLFVDATLRTEVGKGLAPGVPALVALSLLLLLALPLSRAFTLGFVEGVVSGTPDRRSWRAFLRPGVLHFFWSSALTLPLYTILFGAEWAVTGGAWESLLRADERGIALVLLAAVGKFLLVLLPWVLLTLPIMVTLYEWTPLEMVRRGCGPAQACGTVLSLVKQRPTAAFGYLALRLAVQIGGTLVASLAMLPCLAVSGVVGGPLLALAWMAAGALGGPGSGPGVAAITAGVLIWAVLLYCLLCLVLVPVSTLLFTFARSFLEGFHVDSVGNQNDQHQRR